MKEKLKEFLNECGEKLERFCGMTSWRLLFILWLLQGIIVMAYGDISRLNYFCIWILLLMEYADRAVDENNKNNKNNQNNKRNGK